MVSARSRGISIELQILSFMASQLPGHCHTILFGLIASKTSCWRHIIHSRTRNKSKWYKAKAVFGQFFFFSVEPRAQCVSSEIGVARGDWDATQKKKIEKINPTPKNRSNPETASSAERTRNPGKFPAVQPRKTPHRPKNFQSRTKPLPTRPSNPHPRPFSSQSLFVLSFRFDKLGFCRYRPVSSFLLLFDQSFHHNSQNERH